MPKRLDLTGQRFGRLVVIGEAERGKSKERLLHCQCDCGKTHTASVSNLRRGNSKSCGCYRKEIAAQTGREQATHGHSRKGGLEGKAHNAWRAMLKRCYGHTDGSYASYGGRGVTVCDRWNPAKGGSYANFISDMGLPPSASHSIDKDKLGDGTLYSPETCCWLTTKEQCRFRRSSVWVTYQGERMILQEVVDLSGISRAAIVYRIKRGWAECDWLIPAGAKRTMGRM